ncbi:bifunctional purine biosynthesis protein PurH, partial [Trifolium pratense]
MFSFGVSSSTTATISTTAAAAVGSTRILCATIFPHSSSLIPTHHFSSHLPTTSVSSSAQRLRCVPIKAMAEIHTLSVPKSSSSSP